MDGPEIITLSKISQKEKNKYHITYMRNLKKMIQMNLSIKQTHRFREWTYDYQRGSAGGKEEMRV